MDTILYTLAIVLVFGAIIVFHEAGHFFVAKLSKIRVHEFALGLGPRLFSIRRGETDYALRAIPVGGMVRVAGMEPEDIDAPGGFNTKPRYVRAAVIAAGPIMNIILGLLVFIISFAVVGRFTTPTATIGNVIKGKPAAMAGLMAGDKLLAVNGVSSKDLGKLRKQILDNPGKKIEIVFERKGRQASVSVVPEKRKVNAEPVLSKDKKQVVRIRKVNEWVGQIGIVFAYNREHLTLLQSIKEGFGETVGILNNIWMGLVLLVSGRAPVSVSVSGPVGIVGAMYDEARVSWLSFLTFAGIFNIMVAFFNILPFPALDGSRILFLAIEAIRRRPLDPYKEAIIHSVGLALLLLFVLAVTVSDIWNRWGPQ